MAVEVVLDEERARDMVRAEPPCWLACVLGAWIMCLSCRHRSAHCIAAFARLPVYLTVPPPRLRRSPSASVWGRPAC